ncbi:MAG: hypothetical protein JXR07_12990 [Reichenbachiella sp.]
MILFKKILFYPFSLLTFLTKQLSLYLFNRGIWKSVEFETPVISLNTLMNEPTPLEILLLLKLIFIQHTQDSALIIDRKQKVNANLKIKKNEFSYLKRIEGTVENVFIASHLVLGISELIYNHNELHCVLLGNEKFIGPIRPEGRILVVDYQRAFYESEYWPIGELIELKSNHVLADFVILYNTPQKYSIQRAKREIADRIDDSLKVGVIFDNELPSLEDFLSQKPREQLINIEDRDTFEKTLIEIIEKEV